MSSIMACRLPPASPLTPGTGRGVLSSEVRPMDWASLRAGSTVSTTTFLPRSAARSATAAATVVLPTPPEPQQTITRVRGSSASRSMSSQWYLPAGPIPSRVLVTSDHPLFAQFFGQPVQLGEVGCQVGGQRTAVLDAGRLEP